MNFAHERLSGAPVDACVRDGNAVTELFFWLGEILAASSDVTFDHHSHERSASRRQLLHHRANDLRLAMGLLGRIIV